MIAAAEPIPLERPALPLNVMLKQYNGDPLTDAEQNQLEDYEQAVATWDARHLALGIVDLAEILEEGVSPPEMLVDDLIVSSAHHIVYGEKESAKTWLVLIAAVRVVLDGETVLWVDQEMGRNMFAERLKTLGVPPEVVRERFVYSEFALFDLSPGHKALWQALLDYRKPKLVVVDAHTEVLAAAGLSENLGTDIARWHMQYMAPALRMGATTLVIDHTGHSAQDRARGSGHKGAQSKVELHVQCTPFNRDKTGVMTVTLAKNTAAGEIPEVQRFKVGGDGKGGFVFEPATVTSDGKVDQASVARDRVIAALREHAAPTQSQLVAMVAKKKETVVYAVNKLIDQGYVAAVPSGRSTTYSLTDVGRKFWIVDES